MSGDALGVVRAALGSAVARRIAGLGDASMHASEADPRCQVAAASLGFAMVDWAVLGEMAVRREAIIAELAWRGGSSPDLAFGVTRPARLARWLFATAAMAEIARSLDAGERMLVVDDLGVCVSPASGFADPVVGPRNPGGRLAPERAGGGGVGWVRTGQDLSTPWARLVSQVQFAVGAIPMAGVVSTAGAATSAVAGAAASGVTREAAPVVVSGATREAAAAVAAGTARAGSAAAMAAAAEVGPAAGVAISWLKTIGQVGASWGKWIVAAVVGTYAVSTLPDVIHPSREASAEAARSLTELGEALAAFGLQTGDPAAVAAGVEAMKTAMAGPTGDRYLWAAGGLLGGLLLSRR